MKSNLPKKKKAPKNQHPWNDPWMKKPKRKHHPKTNEIIYFPEPEKPTPKKSLAHLTVLHHGQPKESRPRNHQYEVTGRHKPNKVTGPNPPIYRMLIFAPNTVVARSRFWYYLRKLKKIKKANGEIVGVHEVFEKKPGYVKNFGIWLRYDSRSGTTNMFKEFRDTTLCGAVDKLYEEMASRHSARRSSIQIIRTKQLKARECKRGHVLQMHNSKIKLQLLHRRNRPYSKRYEKVFSNTIPKTMF